MSAVLVVGGLALVLAALFDVFQTLFRPAGLGTMSWWIARGVWDLARATRSVGLLSLAGPLGVLAVIASWLVFVAVGWALVIWAFLPEDFVLVEGLDASGQRGFVDALYVSLTALTTLGFGDIAPFADAPRLVIVAEGLLGFVLLTAGISWLLVVTPAVARSRRLAHAAHALWRTGFSLDDPDAEPTLDALATRVRDTESDLLEQPLAFYFRSMDERHSLPNALAYLHDLADGRARGPAGRLRFAVEELADTAAERIYLGGGHERPPSAVIAEYAASQRWRPWSSGRRAVGRASRPPEGSEPGS